MFQFLCKNRPKWHHNDVRVIFWHFFYVFCQILLLVSKFQPIWSIFTKIQFCMIFYQKKWISVHMNLLLPDLRIQIPERFYDVCTETKWEWTLRWSLGTTSGGGVGLSGSILPPIPRIPSKSDKYCCDEFGWMVTPLQPLKRFVWMIYYVKSVSKWFLFSIWCPATVCGCNFGYYLLAQHLARSLSPLANRSKLPKMDKYCCAGFCVAGNFVRTA